MGNGVGKKGRKWAKGGKAGGWGKQRFVRRKKRKGKKRGKNKREIRGGKKEGGGGDEGWKENPQFTILSLTGTNNTIQIPKVS